MFNELHKTRQESKYGPWSGVQRPSALPNYISQFKKFQFLHTLEIALECLFLHLISTRDKMST